MQSTDDVMEKIPDIEDNANTATANDPGVIDPGKVVFENPGGPKTITLTADSVFLGNENLIVNGDIGLNFEKIKTLIFVISGKKYTYNKV